MVVAMSWIQSYRSAEADIELDSKKDTIKTRAQTAAHGAFKGPMDIATQTIKKEGFLALYKGHYPPFPLNSSTLSISS